MDANKLKDLKHVVEDYYIVGLKQSEIAKKNNLSKSKVSRLINEAKEKGYIEIKFRFPHQGDEDLSNELKRVLGLKHVFVSKYEYNEELMFQNAAEGLSDYLNRILKEDQIVGVSWGKTMHSISKRLLPITERGLKVVQLHGGISNTLTDTRSLDIVRNFGKVLKSDWYTLPVPSIVDNSFIAKTLREDSTIKAIFKMIHELEVAIFSVGTINDHELGVTAGYFTPGEFNQLRLDGYVGDICSRYYKADGEHGSGEIYNRIMGVTLEELVDKKEKICLAFDQRKARSIVSAIKGNYINTLFTDQATAIKILKVYNS